MVEILSSKVIKRIVCVSLCFIFVVSTGCKSTRIKEQEVKVDIIKERQIAYREQKMKMKQYALSIYDYALYGIVSKELCSILVKNEKGEPLFTDKVTANIYTDVDIDFDILRDTDYYEYCKREGIEYTEYVPEDYKQYIECLQDQIMKEKDEGVYEEENLLQIQSYTDEDEGITYHISNFENNRGKSNPFITWKVKQNELYMTGMGKKLTELIIIEGVTGKMYIKVDWEDGLIKNIKTEVQM